MYLWNDKGPWMLNVHLVSPIIFYIFDFLYVSSVKGRCRPGLANREHREDSRWAGLFLWPRGPVLSCHWVEIWMLSLKCLHSSPSFYLLFSRSPYYYFNQTISITNSQLIINHSFCASHCFIVNVAVQNFKCHD